MGCFSACFGRSSTRNGNTERPNWCKVLRQGIERGNEAEIADPLETDTDLEDEIEEQLKSSARKKVRFDSITKMHEEDCETESRECENPLAEGEKGNDSGTTKQSTNELRVLLYSSEEEEEKAEGAQGKNQPKMLLDSSEKEKPEEEKTNGKQGRDQAKFLSDSSEKEKTNGKQGKDDASDILSDSSQSSLFTYFPNNRYKNSATSDDECEATAKNGSNLADEVVSNYNKHGHAGPVVQEESSESLFSLSIDSRKQYSTPEIGEKEVSSPFKPSDRAMNSRSAKARTPYFDSVLKPIENLNQWKGIRTKTTSSLKNEEIASVNSEEDAMAFVEKENLYSENEFIIPSSENPTLKQTKRISHSLKDDVIAVDTSLSSWLIESERTPIKDKSPGSVGNSSSKRTKSRKSLEGTPILGALTLDELKQMSRDSSPRRSPSFSPDETPMMGTVGSYFKHTGQAADADSGSCKQTSSSTSEQKGIFCSLVLNK